MIPWRGTGGGGRGVYGIIEVRALLGKILLLWKLVASGC